MGKTPGERLREAREASGLSLDQVSDETKIPPRIVAALERDEYHKVSGPLYVKSFLRAFAQAVGLAPEDIVKVYEQGTGTGAPLPETTEGAVWTEEAVAVRRVGVSYGSLALRAAVALVAVAVLAVGVWFLFLRGDEPETEAPARTTWEEFTRDAAVAGADPTRPAPADPGRRTAADTTAVSGLERLQADSLAADRGRPAGPR